MQKHTAAAWPGRSAAATAAAAACDALKNAFQTLSSQSHVYAYFYAVRVQTDGFKFEVFQDCHLALPPAAAVAAPNSRPRKAKRISREAISVHR